MGDDAARRVGRGHLSPRERRLRPRIERTDGGTFAVNLPEAERAVLASLVPQLRALLVAGDDTLRRLFPPAYANDPERDAEYHALVGDELLEKRLAALDVLEETVAAQEVDEDQLTRWMGAINDLRLVLGTRLDITEDDHDVPDDHPDAQAFAVYHYLTWLLGQIVDALADW